MSFNGRRKIGSAYMANSAASIGQRRYLANPQPLSNHFLPGQLMQPKPLLGTLGPQQLQQQHQGGQQNVQRPNLRQQAQQFVNQQHSRPPPRQLQPPPIQLQPPPQQLQPPPQQLQPPPQQLQPPPQQLQPPPQQTPPPQQQQQVQQPKPKIEETPPAVPSPSEEDANGNQPEDDNEVTEKRLKKKPFWVKRDGKINKKERLRRRNQRLRKILQPKNALMVLNELVGSTPYKLTESSDVYDGALFKCAVLVEGLEHVGIGKSKPSAKASAAEAALKHLVLSKLNTSVITDPNSLPTIDGVGDIRMDIDNEDNLGGISWSHVACYALHKLLTSWDEGSYVTEKMVTSNSNSSIPCNISKPSEKKPAKKLPDNAAFMNPTMLLNQMHPNVTYEEVGKTGNPPHVQFTIKCSVNGESFLGGGSTKKTARKMCAFAACQQVLHIQYSPEFLEENGIVITDDGFAALPGTSETIDS